MNHPGGNRELGPEDKKPAVKSQEALEEVFKQNDELFKAIREQNQRPNGLPKWAQFWLQFLLLSVLTGLVYWFFKTPLGLLP